MLGRWDAPISKELQMVEDEIQRSILSRQKLLTEISLHVIGSGGKRIRPGVALLSFKALGGDDVSEIIGIAAALELIHTATLIHDDINDGGRIRRGKVSAFQKYGVQKALVAGDFLFVRGFRLGGPQNRTIVEMLSDACTNMAESEVLQGDYANDPGTTTETYLKIVEGKTARPIEAGARVGAFLAGAAPGDIDALGSYGLNLGMAFQITDDILDVVGDEAALGKPRGMDFYGGTPTLPLILAMNDGANGKRISELFSKKRKTAKDLSEAFMLLEDSEGVRKARDIAHQYSVRAMSAVDAVPDSVYKDALRALAETVVERDA